MSWKTDVLVGGGPDTITKITSITHCTFKWATCCSQHWLGLRLCRMSSVGCNQVLSMFCRSWKVFKGKGETVITIWPLLCIIGEGRVKSNGCRVGIKTRGASQSDERWRQLCLYEQTLEFIVLHASCAPPSPPNIKWPPPQSGEEYVHRRTHRLHSGHKDTHTHTHPLLLIRWHH